MTKRTNKTPRTLKKFWVFYDPKHLICYTIVFPNGDVWGCSIRPEHPAGYAGNVIENEMVKDTKEYINALKSKPSKLGYELPTHDIPENVMDYINQLITTHKYGK